MLADNKDVLTLIGSQINEKVHLISVAYSIGQKA